MEKGSITIIREVLTAKKYYSIIALNCQGALLKVNLTRDRAYRLYLLILNFHDRTLQKTYLAKQYEKLLHFYNPPLLLNH